MMSNRITMAMAALGLLLTVAGMFIVWLGIAAGSWQGIVVGLAWVAFAGPGTIYAWHIRNEP